MELHEKLKAVRAEKNISQKDAADKIGVSRQTLSNWETGKTYPDIASLISLSDLYRVSLDSLLKEKENPSDYVDYIDKAISVIKNKQKIYKLIEIGGYILLLIAFIVMYWCNGTLESRNQLDVAMRGFLIPSIIVILSLLIGMDEAWGEKRWFLILFFGATFCFTEQFTVMLNAFSNDMPVFLHGFLLPANYSTGAFLSFVGLGIAALARKFNTK